METTLFQRINPKQESNYAHLNGLMFYDIGNEGFAFNRMAERGNDLYAGLMGLTGIVNVKDAKDARDYAKNLAQTRVSAAIYTDYTGLNLQIPEPLYISFDEQAEKINVGGTIALNAHQLDVLTDLATKINAINFNQLSLLHARAIAKLGRFSAVLPNLDVAAQAYAEAARLTFELNQKQRYLDLVQGCSDLELPEHAATIIICAQNLPQSWEELAARFSSFTGTNGVGKLMIKSAVDAGGEVQVIADAANYKQALASIYKQIEAKRTNPMRSSVESFNCGLDEEKGLPLLIQELITETDEGSGLPFSFGLNLFIHSVEQVEIVCSSRQIFRNQERTLYLGSFWETAMQQNLLEAIGIEKVINLGKVFAREGYTGPIGFDGMMKNGRPVLVYDGNVRLTAVFPALAARHWLHTQGINTYAVGHLGYNGILKVSDLGAALQKLKQRGALLTQQTQRGLIMLPDINRKNSYVVMVGNVKEHEISDYFEIAKSVGECRLKNIYM